MTMEYLVKEFVFDMEIRSLTDMTIANYDARFPLELAGIPLGFFFRLLPKTVQRGSIFRHRIQKNICKAAYNIQMSNWKTRGFRMNVLCIKMRICCRKTQFIVLIMGIFIDKYSL